MKKIVSIVLVLFMAVVLVAPGSFAEQPGRQPQPVQCPMADPGGPDNGMRQEMCTMSVEECITHCRQEVTPKSHGDKPGN
jgi:hypothetical protein